MKSERGYALVTVLIIITVFTIVSLSFMGQAVNSIKQNQVVETSSQSVSVAEMGVSYYHTAVKNAFLTKKMEYDNKIKTESLTEEQIATGILNAIAAVFPVPPNTKTPVDGKTIADTKSYYELNSATVINKSDIIEINFLVKGTEDKKDTVGKKETVLESKMSINLSDLSITYGTDIPVTPGYIGITQPTNISSNCINPPDDYSFKENECPDGILITRTDPEYTKNFQKFDGTIYATDSTGTLTLGGVGNKSSIKVHAPSMTWEGTQNNVSKVTMEIKGDLTFMGHFDAIESSLYVGGNVDARGKFELHNSTSTKYHTLIRGKLTVAKNNNVLIDNNITVCVKDTFSTNQKPDIRGTLYIPRGKVDFPIDSTISGKIKYIEDVSDSDLRANCGNTFDGPDDFIDWGEHAQTNVDNINYK